MAFSRMFKSVVRGHNSFMLCLKKKSGIILSQDCSVSNWELTSTGSFPRFLLLLPPDARMNWFRLLRWKNQWKRPDAFLEMIFRRLTPSGSLLLFEFKRKGEFGAREKFKEEWKQQRNLWGPMRHRGRLQRPLIRACCSGWKPCTRGSFTPQVAKLDLCLSERASDCATQSLNTQYLTNFSNSSTTSVYLFNDEEFLTLAALWKCA